MIYELFPNYVPRPPLPRKVGGHAPSSYGSAATGFIVHIALQSVNAIGYVNMSSSMVNPVAATTLLLVFTLHSLYIAVSKNIYHRQIIFTRIELVFDQLWHFCSNSLNFYRAMRRISQTMSLCLPVRPSVHHTPVLCRNR